MNDLSGQYVQNRDADPELDNMIDATERADADGAAEEVMAQQHGPSTRKESKSSNPYMQQASGQMLEAKSMGKMGKDALIGLYDAARNTAQLMADIGVNAGQGEMNREAADKGTEAETLPPVDIAELAPNFVREADALRDKLAAGSEPTDIFVQKASQFAIPFMGAMKLSGSATIAKTAVIDAVTNLAVWDPHETRFADLVKMISPDNKLLNPIIDYIASDPMDSDAEGRFKNVLDGLFASTVIVGAAVSLKGFVEASADTLRYAKNGGFSGPIPGSPLAQRGSVGTGPPKRPYEGVSDNLMGYSKGKPAKGFDAENYSFIQPVRVTWPDGDSIVDAIKGLNQPHALERARRNWDGATIEPLTREEAFAIDPTLEGVLPPPKAGLTVAAADYTSSARTPMVGPERYAAERSLQKRIDSGEVKSSDYWARTPETEFEQALAAKIEESMGGNLVRTVRRKDPITGEAYFTNPPIEQISSKAIVMDLAKQMEPGMYDGKKMSVAQMAKQAGALVKDGSLMMPRPPGGDEIIESLMKKPQSGEPRRSAVTTALGERRTMKRMYGTMSFKLLRDSWGKSIEALDTLLPKARKQVEAEATKLLKEEYNVTDILGKNLKLQKNEKTAVGTRTEPLKVIDTDGVERGVEAVGMSLYQAYEEAGIKICAKAGVCKDGCLGLTSGSNYATGGGSDNAMMKGSRLAHFMATQAMLRDPEAFITVLQKQLRASAASAIANGNKPSVRLNMLSDLPPMVTEKLIKSNPDVMFYDYTKLDSDPIAPNHHLTYSSTGLTQTRYGVENKFQNWKFMQKRLEKSQNITMVFSGDTLPATVLDQETGKIYKVVDGDTHDYRPADAVAPGEPGVVVGLRNKDINYKSKSIDQQVGADGKDGKGFVVGYDPATDGTQYVVPKQPRPGFDTDGLKLGAYVLPAGLFLQQFPHLEDYYPDLVAEALESETEEADS